MCFPRIEKHLPYLSLVLNLFASQIEEFFLPHPVLTDLYVSVTVHREENVKKEYQQHAAIQTIYCQFQMLFID